MGSEMGGGDEIGEHFRVELGNDSVAKEMVASGGGGEVTGGFDVGDTAIEESESFTAEAIAETQLPEDDIGALAGGIGGADGGGDGMGFDDGECFAKSGGGGVILEGIDDSGMGKREKELVATGVGSAGLGGGDLASGEGFFDGGDVPDSEEEVVAGVDGTGVEVGERGFFDHSVADEDTVGDAIEFEEAEGRRSRHSHAVYSSPRSTRCWIISAMRTIPAGSGDLALERVRGAPAEIALA